MWWLWMGWFDYMYGDSFTADQMPMIMSMPNFRFFLFYSLFFSFVKTLLTIGGKLDFVYGMWLNLAENLTG